MEQPKQKTVVLTGNKLELSCKAETTPGKVVSYHWFKCDKDGCGKETLKCYDRNLVVLKANVSHRGYYLCEVSTEIDSRVIHVEVVNSTGINIIMHPPRDKPIDLGEQLTLVCKAKCRNFPVNYQWYFNGNCLPGFTRQQLIIPSIAESDIGSYYCTASSEYSIEVVRSEASQLILSKYVYMYSVGSKDMSLFIMLYIFSRC